MGKITGSDCTLLTSLLRKGLVVSQEGWGEEKKSVKGTALISSHRSLSANPIEILIFSFQASLRNCI